MSRYRPNAPPPRHGVSPSCVVLPHEEWATVLDYLVHRFAKVTPAQWQQRLQNGDVIGDDGQPVDPLSPFTPGRRLYYYRVVEAEASVPFAHHIVYRDDNIVVADKPHFLPVIPSGKYVQETLLVRLKKELGLEHLSPVHRIDRDTAGLVLFSCNPASRNRYHQLFRERQVEKTYHAVAAWNPALEWPLLRESRIAAAAHFMQQSEVAGPVNAITHIRPLRVVGAHALYELRPITGQRHQLRVHMNALGLPLLNDGIYPELLPEGQFDFQHPLQLLAKRLSFLDPTTGVRKQFESTRTLQKIKMEIE